MTRLHTSRRLFPAVLLLMGAAALFASIPALAQDPAPPAVAPASETHPVTGRVVDEAGAPIADAEIIFP